FSRRTLSKCSASICWILMSGKVYDAWPGTATVVDFAFRALLFDTISICAEFAQRQMSSFTSCTPDSSPKTRFTSWTRVPKVLVDGLRVTSRPRICEDLAAVAVRVQAVPPTLENLC